MRIEAIIMTMMLINEDQCDGTWIGMKKKTEEQLQALFYLLIFIIVDQRFDILNNQVTLGFHRQCQ